MLDILSTFGLILGSLGGGGVIILALSNYIGKRWADRMIEEYKSQLGEKLESHKLRLRKSEFLFQKEYDAASSLWTLARAIHPGHTRDGMDWEDAGGDIALNFPSIEKKFDEYLRSHSASLNVETRKELNELMHIAGQGKVYDGSPEDLWESGQDVLMRTEKVAQQVTEALQNQSRS